MTTRDQAFATLGRVLAASVERQRGGSWQPVEMPHQKDDVALAPLLPVRQPVSKGKRTIVIRRQQGRCAYCGAAEGYELHIDHIKPVAVGGTSDLSNLQGLCARCNMRKGARYPYDPAAE